MLTSKTCEKIVSCGKMRFTIVTNGKNKSKFVGQNTMNPLVLGPIVQYSLFFNVNEVITLELHAEYPFCLQLMLNVKERNSIHQNKYYLMH